MLSRSEERFIKNWSEQKEGPRWKFYFQYIVAWGIVFFLILYFASKMFIANIELGKIKYFLIIFPSAFILSAIVTHLIWTINEKKLRAINKRELGTVDQVNNL